MIRRAVFSPLALVFWVTGCTSNSGDDGSTESGRTETSPTTTATTKGSTTLTSGSSAQSTGGATGSESTHPESTSDATGTEATSGEQETSGDESGEASEVDDGGSEDESGGDDCPPPDGPQVFVAVDGNDATADGTPQLPFATINAALAQADPGDTVVVQTGEYRELVTIAVSGRPGKPITLMADCDAEVKVNGEGLGEDLWRPGLLTIEDQSHVHVEGIEWFGLTGQDDQFPAGIWVVGQGRDIQLRNNRVHSIRAARGGEDAGAHGIAVYGTKRAVLQDVRLYDNEVYDLTLGWSEAVVFNGNVRGFEVARNHVHHVDNIAFDFIGFEDDVCGDCSQEDELVGDTLNRARSGRVHENWAHDMSTIDNPAYDGEKSAACYYVDGGASIVIEANIAHDCDLGIELASEHPGKTTRDVIVRNNFIYNNDVTGIATGGYSPGTGAGGGSAQDCVIVHNTIFNSARDGWADAEVLLQSRNVNNHYLNNIIVSDGRSHTISQTGEHNFNNRIDYNLYFGGQAEGVQIGDHAIYGDPQFVGAGTGNLHVESESPAISAGVKLPVSQAVALDFDGDPRELDAPDVGADEFVPKRTHGSGACFEY